jgi:hypothetical protein
VATILIISEKPSVARDISRALVQLGRLDIYAVILQNAITTAEEAPITSTAVPPGLRDRGAERGLIASNR